MQAEQIIKKPILLTEKAARLREDENKVALFGANSFNGFLNSRRRQDFGFD